MQRAALLLFLVSSLMFAAGPALADSEEGWGYELSHDLMSPYCPGRTLAACSSPQAADLREWIVEQEEAGRDQEEVREQLYAEYGEILRSSPLLKDGGQWAYFIPIIAFLVGGGVVVYFLRRQRQMVATTAPPPVASEEEDPELARIIDREIGA